MEFLLIFVLSVVAGTPAIMVTDGGLHWSNEISMKIIKPSSSNLAFPCVIGGCRGGMESFLHALRRFTFAAFMLVDAHVVQSEGETEVACSDVLTL